MNISYDSLNNIKELDIYLCSPSEERIAYLHATDRVFSPCYNDLSVFSIRVYECDLTADTYDLIQTMRLIEATDIGYFQITDVKEQENEEGKYKDITAESYQTVFKRFGIDVRNRQYSIYNSAAPKAALSEHGDDPSFVPSIVAELHDQIGVEVSVQPTDTPDTTKHAVWTVTYVDELLLSTYRTMDENVEFAYDLLVNKVEEAFGCVVVFDYQFKSIKFYSLTSVGNRGNAYLSFDNFMTDAEITEDASDITTVLRCEGDGVDISLVNPTGAGYITDFSYYKNTQWMSQALIYKLNAWENDVSGQTTTYANKVLQYRTALSNIRDGEAKLETVTRLIQNMKVGIDKYAQYRVGETSTDNSHEVTVGESVSVGEKSLAPNSFFNLTAFSGTSVLTVHQSAPTWNGSAYAFSDAGTVRTADEAAAAGDKLYFTDGDSPRSYSYCKLLIKANPENLETYIASGFDRFIAYVNLGRFTALQEASAASIKSTLAAAQLSADTVLAQMKAISGSLNIKSYFSDTPALYQELKNFWIEGTYEDPSIAILESTTPEEAVALAQELMSVGAQELTKVCQPRFRLSVRGVNCFANEELADIAKALNLGDVMTIEKNDSGLLYHAVLLKLTHNFDEPSDLELELANSLRLDDWGFTMADLISDASTTSRSVSSNWQELFAFVRERDSLYRLVDNPLDAALRAANENMSNQDFAIDTTGILGRKVTISESGGTTTADVGNEQIRILNNMIIFTENSWEDASAAFGKITYIDPTDPDDPKTAYGLVADALVGRLILGNRMVVATPNGLISLDGNGITIKNLSDVVTFRADTSGNVSVAGTINTGDGNVGGWTIDTNSIYKQTGIYTTGLYSGGSATSYAMSVVENNGGILTTNFAVRNNGSILATNGTVAGWNISSSGITKNVPTSGNNKYVVGMYSSSASNGTAFSVYYNTTTDTRFSVDNQGNLIAKSASIKGEVSADSFGVPGVLTAKKDSSTVVVMKPIEVNGTGVFSGNVQSGAVSTQYLIGTATQSGTSGVGSIIATVNALYDSTTDMVALSYSFSNTANWNRTNGATISIDIVSLDKTGNTVTDTVTYYVKPSTTNSTTATVYYSYSGITYSGIKKASDPDTQTQLTFSLTQTVQTGGSNSYLYVGVAIGQNVDIVPFNSGAQNLGDSSHRWGTVWCQDVNSSSSRDVKTDIKTLDEAHEKLFDKLIPRSFKFKNDNDTHYGFIVDEVVAAAKEAGLDENCGLYELADPSNPMVNGALRYNEIIALAVAEIQKLKARLKDLENHII